MVSAFSICFLAIGIAAVSSQFVSEDSEDVPVSERRTFKHGKHVKILPLVKKHKKFGLFSKPAHSEIPIIHEAPRPLYKYHRYQGIEVKPIHDIVSTPEPIIETHSVEPPTFHDYAPAFPSDHSSPHDPSVFAYQKPFISSPAFVPFSPLKPAFTFIPAPQPIFSSFPISIPAPAPIARPVQPSPPVFVSIPSVSAPPPPPVFQTIPVKIQSPVLPPLPAPSPAPVFSTVTVAPPPAGSIFTPIASFPPPAISIPATSPTIAPFPALPSPVPSFSISTPEPEFPYPPSGTPVPSYIKDISLGDVSLKETAVPTIETPKYEDVPPVVINEDSKTLDQSFLQKFKGWKAEKASAALSYFKKPAPISFSQPIKPPLELLPSQAPIHPSLQFNAPAQPLPLAPSPFFFRPQFIPPVKYESFPPNHIESPPALFNSYGAPIPHDSYASDHISHERLSSASEEQPVVLPSPGEQKQDQNLLQQPSSQVRQELTPKYQPHEQPIYVPEENKNEKEENKANEEVQQDVNNYQSQQESNADDVAGNLRNHKI